MTDSENPFDEGGEQSSSSNSVEQVRETTLAETSASESTKKLLAAERLYIRRPRDPDQILVAFDVAKKFEILNQNGEAMFYMVQEDSCCSRTFCCSNKWFTLDIYDLDEVHIGQLERGIGCLSCWCGCCPQSMSISFPPRKRIGTVEQQWSIVGAPGYRTVNHKRDLVFLMSGSNFCGVKKIKLFSGTDDRIGKMKNEWDGLPTDTFNSQNCFGVSLSGKGESLDLEHRYLLIGSAFLMAYNYFGANKRVTHEELIGLKKS